MPRVKHLLNFTLSGLPELQYFESDEAREKALTEIGTEAGSPQRVAMKWISWPRWLEDVLLLLTVAITFFLVLRALHRSGAAGELRAKLLASGIPVCTGCGYLLRGLPLDAGRCPECGRGFDDNVRRILSATSAPLEQTTTRPTG